MSVSEFIDSEFDENDFIESLKWVEPLIDVEDKKIDVEIALIAPITVILHKERFKHFYDAVYNIKFRKYLPDLKMEIDSKKIVFKLDCFSKNRVIFSEVIDNKCVFKYEERGSWSSSEIIYLKTFIDSFTKFFN